jgi:hypothetical protein
VSLKDLHFSAVAAPQSHCFVFTKRNNDLTVRAETQAQNLVLMPLEHLQLSPIETPKLYRFIFTARGNELTVRTETHAPNSSAMSLEGFE